MTLHPVKEVRILLTGFGYVGRAFVQLLAQQSDAWETRYGLRFRLTGVAGSGGLLYAADGLEPEALLAGGGRGTAALRLYAAAKAKAGGGSAAWLKHAADADWGALADVLVEATPTRLGHGEPGFSYMRQAFAAGLDVVAVSKGAMVTHFGALREAARAGGARLRFSGATAAALPTLDLGEYALAGCTIERIEGILNGTTNYILTRMQEQGVSFEEALREAQARGIAETNPAQDVQGTDSACKLVLLANALLGASCSLGDVDVTGIERVTPEAVEAAKRAGRKLKLLATAIPLPPGDAADETQAASGGATLATGEAAAGGTSDAPTGRPRFRLEVAPRELEPGHPLFGVDRTEKGIVFRTDLMGTVAAIGGASSPTGAAAAAWKDLINLYREPY